jgi:type IV secretory pathway VirJ component
MKIFCFCSEDDSGVICQELDPALSTSIVLKGGHRVRGNFAPISKAILEDIK